MPFRLFRLVREHCRIGCNAGYCLARSGSPRATRAVLKPSWRVADTLVTGWPCLIVAMAHVPDFSKVRSPTVRRQSAGSWELHLSRLRQDPPRPSVIEIRTRRQVTHSQSDGTNNAHDASHSNRANRPRSLEDEDHAGRPASTNQHERHTHLQRVATCMQADAGGGVRC